MAHAGAIPSWADLRKVADAQMIAIRALMIGAPLLLALHVLAGKEDPPAPAVIAGLVISLAMAGTLYWLGAALHEPAPILWALLVMLHPALGLIVFAILRTRATALLRGSGVDVGVLGGRLPDAPPPGVTCRETSGTTA